MKKFVFFKKIFIVVAIFLSFFAISFFAWNVREKFVIADEKTENPAGWSWNNIFGWNSGNCNARYGEEYEDFCGIKPESILDMNFDGLDLNFNTNIVKDNSQSSFNGTLHGLTSTSTRNRTGTSNFNNSLYFDGNDYVDVGAHDELNFTGLDKSFSVSAWFKIDETPTSSLYIFSNGGMMGLNKRYTCLVKSDYSIVCIINGMDTMTGQSVMIASDPNIITLNTWHNITITYGNGIFSMYLDHQKEAGSGLIGTRNVNYYYPGGGTYNFYIGARKITPSMGLSGFFKGEIDEVRFFNYALSEDQILHNMYHNSNYSFEVDKGSGQISGWAWSNGYGWMCFGKSCGSGSSPTGEPLSDSKLHWSGDYQHGIYPHMLTGWAKAISLDNFNDNGWISLQGAQKNVSDAALSNCASCVVRDQEENLIAYWKFNEDAGGVVADSSGDSHNGVLHGFSDEYWKSGGVVGNYLEFDGIDDYVGVDNMPLSDKMTLSFWLKSQNNFQKYATTTEILEGIFLTGMSTQTSGMTIANSGNSKFGRFNWRIQYPNQIFGINNAFLLDNAWHYYVVTRDGVNVKFYRDGVFVGEAVFPGYSDPNINANVPVALKGVGRAYCSGCYRFPPNPPTGYKAYSFKGGVDHIRFYNNRILDQDEILYSYNHPESVVCSGCFTKPVDNTLHGFWKFDEGIGQKAYDSSINKRDGVLQNFSGAHWTLNGALNSYSYLNFDGVDDYVQVDNMTAQTTSTLTFWIKSQNNFQKYGTTSTIREGLFELGALQSTAYGDGITILNGNKSQYAQILWRITPDTSIPYAHTNYVRVNDYVLMDNAWHHYAVVRNGINVKFYRDGVYKNQDDFNGYLDCSSATYPNCPYSTTIEKNIAQKLMYIGRARCGSCGKGSPNTSSSWLSIGRYPFLGGIDHVKLYNNRLLNDDEIMQDKINGELLFGTDEGNICYDCKKCSLSDDGINNCDKCSTCRQYGIVFDTNTASLRGYAWGKGIGWIKFSPKLGSGIYRSYVSAKYGNIYSKSDIGSDYSITPPFGFYNASYLIQANGHITNWLSEQAVKKDINGKIIGPDFNPDKPWISYFGNPKGFTSSNYDYPTNANDYGNILGSIDFKYLNNNALSDLPGTNPSNPNVCLQNKIYKKVADSSLEVVINARDGSNNAYIFQNCDEGGAGTIIIDGDLIINGNISYDTGLVSGSNKKLASVAWIILGDLKIGDNVTKLAGTFIVLGKSDVTDCGSNLSSPTPKCGIIYTGNSADKQLSVSGQFLAKNFQFQRTYRDQYKNPAELITYDGRNVINTPPGLGDELKSLPRWDQIAPY